MSENEQEVNPDNAEGGNDTPAEITEGVEDTGEGAEKPKKARKPRKKSAPKSEKPRSPRLKDWVRVVKSQGNDVENTTVHLIINDATGLVELRTNAPKMVGSEEMEGERMQVFRITSFEVISDAERNPLAEEKSPDAPPAEGSEVAAS